MKKYEEMAKAYVDLSEIAQPTSEEAQKYSQLRRQLSARGLDPQHPVELEYRARIYDHRSRVETFVSLHEHDSRTPQLYIYLKNHGINPDDRQKLRYILTQFKLNAKATDRKKTARSVRPTHENSTEQAP